MRGSELLPVTDTPTLVVNNEDWVHCVSWSSDGTKVACSSLEDVVVINTEGKVLATLTGHKSVVKSVAWSPDFTQLATACDSLRVFNLSNGECVATIVTAEESMTSCAWSPDGLRLVAPIGTILKAWDARVANGGWRRRQSIKGKPTSGHNVELFSQHESAILSVAFSPSGKHLATSDDDGAVYVFDSHTGADVKEFHHPDSVSCVVFSSNSKLIATGCNDHFVRVFNAVKGEAVQKIDAHDDWVTAVTFSPTDHLVASAAFQGERSIHVWDVSTGGEVKNISDAHEGGITTLSWNSTGDLLASGSCDFTMKLWDVSGCEEDRKTISDGNGNRSSVTSIDHEDAVRTVAWSPDGNKLASGGDDRTVRVWDGGSGMLLNTFTNVFGDWVNHLCWSPDGTQLAVACGDMNAYVLTVETEQTEMVLGNHGDWVQSICWMQQYICTCSFEKDPTIRIWDCSNGTQVAVLEKHTDRVLSVSMNASCTRLVSGGEDCNVYVWDIDQALTKKEPAGVLHHITEAQPVMFVQFSSEDVEKFAVAFGPCAKVYDSTSGECMRVFEGHRMDVVCLSWSPDGKQLVTGSKDRSVRVWNIANRKATSSGFLLDSSVYGVTWDASQGLSCALESGRIVHLGVVKLGEDKTPLRWQKSFKKGKRFSSDRKKPGRSPVPVMPTISEDDTTFAEEEPAPNKASSRLCVIL